MVFAYGGLRLLTTTPAEASGAMAVFALIDLSVPLIYGRFLATLDSPMVRWLRSPWATPILLAYTMAGFALWFMRSDLFIQGMTPIGGTFAVVRGPLWVPVLNVVPFLALVFGLAASISAYQRAETASARSSARWVMLAFGTRDALTAVIIVIGATSGPASEVGFFVPVFGFALVDILHVALLAYAILRAQVFDIDLRIQRAVRTSVLGGAFIAAFLVASQIAQNLLNEAYGVLAGGAAAGVLLFAVRPLQRVADGVSRAALPQADGSAEYLAFRKCEVYREALAEMTARGEIMEKERAVLARIQHTLGLAPDTVLSIERDVLGRPAPSAPVSVVTSP